MNIEITLTVQSKGGETDWDAALVAQSVLRVLRDGNWKSAQVTKCRRDAGWQVVNIDDVNSLTLSETP